jgi:hypothetical protein
VPFLSTIQQGLRARLSRPQAILAAAVLFWWCWSALRTAADTSGANLVDTWSVGDWLINYAGGFTRRGLSGSLILPCAAWLGVRPQALVVAVKAGAYLGLFGFSAALLLGQAAPPLLPVLALFSAAGLYFPVQGPLGGGRKEILLLALAAWALWRAARGKPRPNAWVLAAAMLLVTACHEGLFFFFPMALLCLRLAYLDEAWGWSGLALPLLPSAAFLAYVSWRGPSSHAQILAVVRAFSPGDVAPWDNGAILFLNESARDGLLRVATWMGPGALSSLGWTLLAALTPSLLWLGAELEPRYRRSPAFLRLREWAWLALAAQIPVYFVALDWGRWIMISATLLGLACLALAQRRGQARWRLNWRPAPRVGWLALCLCSLLYLGTWRLPHCCAKGGRNDGWLAYIFDGGIPNWSPAQVYGPRRARPRMPAGPLKPWQVREWYVAHRPPA